MTLIATRHAPLAATSIYFGNNLSRTYREVGVNLIPRGFRHDALSISRLSPISNWPDAFFVRKIASLIFRPESRFLPLTSFHSFNGPSLSFGSSSLISRRRHFLSLSPARLQPPGNIQSLSRRRLTRSTRPFFAATSFEDFAIFLRIDTGLGDQRATAKKPCPRTGLLVLLATLSVKSGGARRV